MTTRSERIFAYAFLTLFSIIALYPVVGALLLALHPRDALVSGLTVPWPLHFETFKEAWNIAHLSTYLRSSFIVSTAVVIGRRCSPSSPGTPSGRCASGGEPLFYLLLSGMILPFEAVVIPLYYNFDAVGLTNTYSGPHPPADRDQRVLRHLLDARLLPLAAQDHARGRRDGWRRKRAHVVLGGPAPGRPAVLTLVLLTFMFSWNEFLLPLVMVTDENLRTAPLGLAFFAGQHNTDRIGQAAAAVIVSAPSSCSSSSSSGRSSRGWRRAHSRSRDRAPAPAGPEKTTKPMEGIKVNVDLSRVLSDEDVRSYHERGFLVIDELTTGDEVLALQDIYDRLFDPAAEIGDRDRLELAGDEGAPPVLPQILNPDHYAPELRETQAYRDAGEVARRLLGDDVRPMGCTRSASLRATVVRPPGTRTRPTGTRACEHEAISVWMPLQPATIENGCMQFVPEATSTGCTSTG